MAGSCTGTAVAAVGVPERDLPKWQSGQQKGRSERASAKTDRTGMNPSSPPSCLRPPVLLLFSPVVPPVLSRLSPRPSVLSALLLLLLRHAADDG